MASSIETTPTKKASSRGVPQPPQKKAKFDLGTDDNYDVFPDPFTDTQIEAPGYYDRQFTQPNAQFFDPSFHQVLGGYMPYANYEPIVPQPNQFAPQYTMPQSVAPPPPAPQTGQNVAPSDPPKRKRFGVGGGRKRVEPTETKHRKLQRFSSVIFCDKCDERTSFDGTTLKVEVCPDCVVKSGTLPM